MSHHPFHCSTIESVLTMYPYIYVVTLYSGYAIHSALDKAQIHPVYIYATLIRYAKMHVPV